MRLSASSLLAGLTAIATVSAQVSCGRNNYTSDEIEEASEEACKLFRRRSQVGRNNYPHRYNNFEGLELNGYDAPFQEFPIVSGGVYDGGPPGPDRVVITQDGCNEAGVITHSGARGNSFIECEAVEDDDDDDDSDDGDDDDSDDSGAARFTAASLWCSLAVGVAAYLL